MPRRSRLVARALLISVAAASSCAAPIQNGGVEIRSGVEQRLGMLCRWRHGDVAGSPCAPADLPSASPARVRRIAGDKDRLHGPLAIGRDGDYLLENDEIAIVVDQLGPGTGFAEGGGNIVDAADAKVRIDELGQIFTYFGAFPRQAVYDALESGVDDKGTAWIQVSGRELYEEALRVTTRYELAPGSRALLLRTQVVNEKAAPVAAIDLGDAVQWGSAEKIGPGKAAGFTGDFSGPYIGGVGQRAAYAILDVSPEPHDLSARNGTAWSNISFRRGVTIAPGATASYERALVIAPRGDTAAIATELFYLRGGSPGGIDVKLFTSPEQPVVLRSGGRVLLAPASADGTAPWIRAADDRSLSSITAELPPGRYLASFEGDGRRSDGAPVPVTVESGKVAEVRVQVSGSGTLALDLHARELDPATRELGSPYWSPGKVQIFELPSNRLVVPPLFMRGERVDLPVPPGQYRVVASRGPEYAIDDKTVEVGAGAIASVSLEVPRVVDTHGYIGCDFHQHTSASADSGVSARDRLLGDAAEGVECAVLSEHNAIVDHGKVVAEAGLAPYVRAIVGEELTADASREPFGHANVFPLAADPGDPRGGALPVRDRTAAEIFADVRKIPGEHVLQINHPRAGRTGYFDQLHFDRATGVGTGPGYDGRFDAIEIWSGRHTAERGRVLDDLWALLRTSHPVTPTANTDTHGVVGQEAGYPRTYVRVPDDDPARLDVGALVSSVLDRRDVVLTNGPFVILRSGDISQGGLVSLGPRSKLVVVTVERAPWVSVQELVLWVGGIPSAPIPLPGVTTRSGSIRDEIRIRLVRGPAKPAAGPPVVEIAAGARSATLTLAGDTFLVAAVSGKRPLTPVLAGDPAEILPFAMTSPLWIDADGDGRALGRETLSTKGTP